MSWWCGGGGLECNADCLTTATIESDKKNETMEKMEKLTTFVWLFSSI